MSRLFLLLILINASYYGWEVQRHASHPGTIAGPIPTMGNPEILVLLSETSANTANRPLTERTVPLNEVTAPRP